MAQGIWSGIGLGAVFSVGVAGVVSVLVPIEPQPAPQLGTAGGVAEPQPPLSQPAVTVTSQGNGPATVPQASLRAPVSEELPKEPEAAALAPQIATELDGTVQEGATSPAAVTLPEPETAALAPQPAPLPQVNDAVVEASPVVPAPLPQPRTGGAADLTTPRPLPEGMTARAGEDAPVLPNPQALAPMIPDDSADAQIVEEIPEPQAPGGETDAEATAEAALPEEPVEELALEQAGEEAGEEPLTISEIAPRPRVLPAPGTAGAPQAADERPRIGRPATTLINPTAEEAGEVETVTQAAPTPDTQAPVRRFAQPFDNPEGKPLMSIVLMDTGADLEAEEIGLPALSSFPYPVSFAIDVSLPDAAIRMQRYRAEGFDVLAIVDLPPGAQPSDAEVSLSVALDTLGEVVGVLEGTGEGLQTSREVADQVTGILKASGHGLVAQSRGLNSMPKLAVKEGVPAAAVFRDFDSEGQQARVIRRFLDQAAFKAGQEGGVIMLGRLRPETIEALLVWGLADRAGAVALAPVSAVLLAQQ